VTRNLVSSLAACIVALTATSASPVAQPSGELAQPSPAQAQPVPTPVAPAIIPLDVQIVVNRYQDEKRISSLPYVVAVNANEESVGSLRMGAKVPVPALSQPKDGPQTVAVGPVNYQDIGTNIDCYAKSVEGGGFNVSITIEDTSVYTAVKDGTTPPALANMPVFRNFRSSNSLILRDGQTRQFTAATDRVSGEVVRVEVTLRLAK
jgi:hypothetical protein